MNIELCDDQNTWDKQVNMYQGHPLQLWGWGEVKSKHNWRVYRLLARQGGRVVGGASVLIRQFPGPIPPLAYVSRGPFGDLSQREALLEALVKDIKQRFKPLALSIEPEWTDMPVKKGWKKAANTIIIPRTGIININQSDDELLGVMTKKTRQYINKSGRADIKILPVVGQDELDKCMEIYHQTAQRAGFALHGDDYYRDIYAMLGDANLLYAAWSGDEMLAFLWVAASDTTAFELYGGVNEAGQRLRANYTLKWQVIQQCKRRNLTRYDLNGLLNDGISTFKRGFISEDTEFIGTYDYPMSAWYQMYSSGLPLAKRLIRLIKR